jgi:hypothetical protein
VDLPYVFKDSEDIRTAVTAAFLTLYLAFVAAAFNKEVNAAFKDGGLFKAVWDSFNPLMIAIVGFYFGGKAFEKSTTSRAGGSPSQSGDDLANERGVYRWLVSLDSRSVRKGVARDRAEADTAASDALDELSR